VLLLFDIDGTLLLKASAAHAQAVHEALREVYGVAEPGVPKVEAAGRTDAEIARAICVHHDVGAERFDDGFDAFRAACAAAYARLCPADLRAHVAPGMIEVLEALATRDGVRLAVLTGNLEPIARIKLARAGLARFFEEGQGSFGSDHEDRTALPATRASRR
jgi:phosphoglycolate phosphatase